MVDDASFGEVVRVVVVHVVFLVRIVVVFVVLDGKSECDDLPHVSVVMLYSENCLFHQLENRTHTDFRPRLVRK